MAGFCGYWAVGCMQMPCYPKSPLWPTYITFGSRLNHCWLYNQLWEKRLGKIRFANFFSSLFNSDSIHGSVDKIFFILAIAPATELCCTAYICCPISEITICNIFCCEPRICFILMLCETRNKMDMEMKALVHSTFSLFLLNIYFNVLRKVGGSLGFLNSWHCQSLIVL